jgi:hypothetical protein
LGYLEGGFIIAVTVIHGLTLTLVAVHHVFHHEQVRQRANQDRCQIEHRFQWDIE